MVEAADGKGTPPPELKMAWMCRSWGALPEAGGVMEQDYVLIRRMQTLLNIYDAMSALRSAKGQAIHNLPRHHKKTLGALQEMGFSLGIGS